LSGRKKKQPLCGKEPSRRRTNMDATQLSLTVKDVQYAGTVVIKATQATAFKDEIKVLSKTKEAKERQGRRPRSHLNAETQPFPRQGWRSPRG